MADEKINEEAENESPIKKEKKQKTPRKEGEIPMLFMIGGALGVVVMIIVSVIIGTVIANKLFPPVGFSVASVEGHGDGEHEDEDGKVKLKPFVEEDIEDTISLLQDEKWLTIDNCKAQTNVKGSASTLGIITIAAIYKPYYTEELSNRGFLTEGGKDGHGNPLPPGVNKESELYKKLQVNIKSALTSFISKHTAEELQDLQSNGDLPDSLKSALKNPFKDIGLVLGKVDITDFMVTKI